MVGDAIPVNPSVHRVQRQRAEERHGSDSYPAWCMYRHVEAAGGWDAIAPNEHFKPTLPIINNVVATAQCVNCVPDMRRLVWWLGGSRSHGEFARPVTASLWREGATMAIQISTGILNITGNKSPGAAVIACWAYMETVARHLHIPLQLAKFDVFNAQATFNVGGYIDLHALHRAVPLSIYAPELISHVSITIKTPRVTVLVWASGAVVVNGCRTREEHMRVYYDFGFFLSQFVRAGGGGRRKGNGARDLEWVHRHNASHPKQQPRPSRGPIVPPETAVDDAPVAVRPRLQFDDDDEATAIVPERAPRVSASLLHALLEGQVPDSAEADNEDRSAEPLLPAPPAYAPTSAFEYGNDGALPPLSVNSGRPDERGSRVHLQESGAIGLRPTLWVRGSVVQRPG